MKINELLTRAMGSKGIYLNNTLTPTAIDVKFRFINCISSGEILVDDVDWKNWVPGNTINIMQGQTIWGSFTHIQVLSGEIIGY